MHGDTAFAAFLLKKGSTPVLHAHSLTSDILMCCAAVYLGIFQYKYFQSNLFDLQPDLGKTLTYDHPEAINLFVLLNIDVLTSKCRRSQF